MNKIYRKSGFRGYITSRAVGELRIPQRVQNIIIREYCARRSLVYLLSSTEYVMPGCYMMLGDILRELERVEGLVAFSIFMLPTDRRKRLEIYRQILQSDSSLHVAMENMSLSSNSDIELFEDIIHVSRSLPFAPLSRTCKTLKIATDDADRSFVDSVLG